MGDVSIVGENTIVGVPDELDVSRGLFVFMTVMGSWQGTGV